MRPIDADALMQTIANTAADTVDKARKSCEAGTQTFTEALDRLAKLMKEIVYMINEAPTLSPDDCRPQGRWENYPSHIYRRCSVCKVEFDKPSFNVRANYCPNCGAKMDGKENNT